MRGGKKLESFILLKIESLLDGVFIHSRLEVAVQFEVVGRGVDSVENGVDHSPEVSGMVERALIYSLGAFGKVGVVVINEKTVEASV